LFQAAQGLPADGIVGTATLARAAGMGLASEEDTDPHMADLGRARGVDVSAIQRVVPWDGLVAAGVDFAFMRCSIGNDSGRDSMFAENVARARAHGLKIGAYHFGYPLPHLDPKAQAQIAFSKAEKLGALAGEITPAFDHEWPAPENWKKWGCTATQVSDWGLAYLEAATRLWGCKPLLYTYPYFAQSSKLSQEYADYPLWIADYSGKGRVPAPSERPRIIGPWGTKWTIWQHDGDGGLKLPNGVDADFNVFNGDEDDLGEFCAAGKVIPARLPDLAALPAGAITLATASLITDDAIRLYRQTRIAA
jgi:GH25 family lysozyme M1 (1,4-beta-N-acetylmuramidase)